MRHRSANTIGFLLIAFMLLASNAHAQFFGKKETKLLAGEEAFQVTAQIQDQQVKMFWNIADDYYMYRDQFSIKATTEGVEIGELVFPEGVVENDPEFGEVVVYFYNAEITAPIQALPQSGNTIELTLLALGCNKPVGVCYPPQTREITLEFDPDELSYADLSSSDSSKVQNLDDSNNAIQAFSAEQKNQDNSFLGYVTAAFLAGVLLSFTPCVLPMIPILLGVIAGQKSPSKLRSGWLAICYVAGTIVVYAIAGWIAGRTGAQLQAYFQNPWVIGFICSMLILLAASLFGAFKIQLPSSIQTKLNNTSIDSRSASFTSFGLGLISSLVVGACVSPILIVTLTAALSQGDPILGSAVMSSMALGMGLLLIVLGFGAGWLLPRAGAWMNHVQILFGFWVLGAAIYIASFNDAVPALYLWAVLLLWNGFYVWQIGTATVTPFAKSLILTLASILLLWGVMAGLGGVTGGTDILKPLETVSVSSGPDQRTNKLPFSTVTNLTDSKKLLQEAQQAKKPVLVDFYADWCPDCKRMARTTFREPAVHQALEGWQLIEVDVTETNRDSEELKQFFDVFGPPATLFIKSDGTEHGDLRQYGYLSKDDFLTLIARATQ